MQAKLLTAIEKQCITRLGAVNTIHIDVRLICATNANLHQLVAEGKFRQDLLYRINTVELHIPPLRERGEDILLLATHFLNQYNRKYRKEIKGLTREAKNKLLKYEWPGNVRELQHTVERAVILSENGLLKPDDFLFPQGNAAAHQPALTEELNLEKLEKNAIERALKVSAGNMSKAAELLGITRFALYRKLENGAYENVWILPDIAHFGTDGSDCRRCFSHAAWTVVLYHHLRTVASGHLLQPIPHTNPAD